MRDILVILMVAFGLFTILMFILFYVYVKKHYNNKHTSDDYRKELEDSFTLKEELSNKRNVVINDDEFVPKRKK